MKHSLSVGGLTSDACKNPILPHFTRYDFVEIEDMAEKTVLGRWCGSQSAPTSQTSKGSQIRIRFISDEYFPSEPGFCIRYALQPVVSALSGVKGQVEGSILTQVIV